MTAVNLVDASITVSGTSTTATFGERFTDIVNAKRDFGAVGDGVTDDYPALQAAINYCFGSSSSPHGEANKFLNKPLFIPAGNYLLSSSLQITALRSGFIFGAGKSVTILYNPNGDAVATNGCAHSNFTNLTFRSGSGGAALNLNWDNVAPVSLNANSFYDCGFVGDGASYGCRVALSGIMGSENLFVNCSFENVLSGLSLHGQNALDNTVIGGSVRNCYTGMVSFVGSFQYIGGVSFQNNTADISMGQPQLQVIQGCRSTNSAAFIANGSGPMMVVGCKFDGQISGFGDPCTLLGCSSNATVGDSLAYAVINCDIPNASYGGQILSTMNKLNPLGNIRDLSDGLAFRQRDNNSLIHNTNYTFFLGFNTFFPPGNVGLEATFAVQTALPIRIQASTTERIYINGTVTSPTGAAQIVSDVPGSSVTLVRATFDQVANGGILIAVASNGTWTVL